MNDRKHVWIVLNVPLLIRNFTGNEVIYEYKRVRTIVSSLHWHRDRTSYILYGR
jgi:hypothetical protein